MKIAVCDDSRDDLMNIKNLFDRLEGQPELCPEVFYFSCGEELISAAAQGNDFSLAIFDIYMNGIDGVTAAAKLKEILPDVQTAFLTTSAEHAVDAFGLDALHYIVKPVTEEKLSELLERFLRRTRSPKQKLVLKSKTKQYSFPASQVQKIQSGNKGVDVYLQKFAEPVHIPESFSSIEEQLDAEVFLKIFRGLIVNMSHILCIDKDICRFRDGTETLVSRKDKEEIRRRYNDYLFSN